MNLIKLITEVESTENMDELIDEFNDTFIGDEYSYQTPYCFQSKKKWKQRNKKDKYIKGTTINLGTMLEKLLIKLENNK